VSVYCCICSAMYVLFACRKNSARAQCSASSSTSYIYYIKVCVCVCLARCSQAVELVCVEHACRSGVAIENTGRTCSLLRSCHSALTLPRPRTQYTISCHHRHFAPLRLSYPCPCLLSPRPYSSILSRCTFCPPFPVSFPSCRKKKSLLFI
jgi:hypothetical protein